MACIFGNVPCQSALTTPLDESESDVSYVYIQYNQCSLEKSYRYRLRQSECRGIYYYEIDACMI
jgi:hypothetical protein